MIFHRPSRNRGFSLIEVLIAVVVMAIGLLALGALQASLTRSSAEAKVRSRVTAFMAGRMEFLRNGPYDNIGAAAGSCTPTTTTGFVPAEVCADAALGSLTVNQTSTTWAGDTTFAAVAGPVTDPKAAQFKRVRLTATWTDASGDGHTLSSVSDISPLGLVSDLIVPPDSETNGGGSPKVRQDNPVTAGMIPVALGDGSSSAASNPKPELKQDGRNQRIVATRFNVLNYIPEGDGSTVIQKRFENEVVRCKCSMGSGESDTASIYYDAKWPAVWTGDRYDVYVPTPATTAAPGQALRSGPRSGVVQSDLCTQCCRDHHDGDTGAKYDPERVTQSGESTGHEKYTRNSSNQYVVSTTTYMDSCRVIRVDGFWRVAADTYSRHFGLLETQPVAAVKAKTGDITTAAKSAYETFIKDYSQGYQTTIAGGSGDPPVSPEDADTLFDQTARGLNAAAIDILTPNVNGDWRYLHARGLYIDHLEADARKRISDVLADNGPQGLCPPTKPRYDCILPYLPFTTINVTELAKWLAGNSSILQVNSGNIMSSNPLQPFGGRTKGIAAGTDLNTGSALRSNSGLAVYAVAEDTNNDGVLDTVNREDFGVDPQDDAQVGDDAQEFVVGGVPNTNTGQSFYLRLTGAGINRSARYSLGAVDVDDCTTPATGDIRCQTNQASGAMTGSFTLENYWIEGNTTANISTAGCTNYSNQTPPATISLSTVPTFTNLVVSGVSVISGSGTITTGMPAEADSGDGTTSELTTVSFANVGANTVIGVTFGADSTPVAQSATRGSCSVDRVRGDWVMTVDSWTKPWDQ